MPLTGPQAKSSWAVAPSCLAKSSHRAQHDKFKPCEVSLYLHKKGDVVHSRWLSREIPWSPLFLGSVWPWLLWCRGGSVVDFAGEAEQRMVVVSILVLSGSPCGMDFYRTEHDNYACFPCIGAHARDTRSSLHTKHTHHTDTTRPPFVSSDVTNSMDLSWNWESNMMFSFGACDFAEIFDMRTFKRTLPSLLSSRESSIQYASSFLVTTRFSCEM